MADAAEFKYEPLGSDQLRLLYVKGLDEHRRVECTLEHQTMTEDSHRYVAISYTWGPEGDEVPININGKTLKVRRNIHEFLSRVASSRVRQPSGRCGPLPSSHGSIAPLRVSSTSNNGSGSLEMPVELPNDDSSFQYMMDLKFDESDKENQSIETDVKPPRVKYCHKQIGLNGLWIDAICINQADTMERNKQVKKMGEIYKTARSVMVWLSSGNPKITKWLSRMANTPPTRSHGQCWNDTALYDLLRLDYWSRAWIVQELFVAEEIVLMCDRYRITWENLWLSQKPYDVERRMNMTTAHLQYRVVSKQISDDTFESMLVMLSKEGLKCKEKQDRIYSLLAVVKNGSYFDVRYKEENIVQLAFRAALFFGENAYTFGSLLYHLPITVEEWKRFIEEITYRRRIGSLNLRMDPACCALPVQNAGRGEQEEASSDSKDLPHFKVTQLARTGIESRCPFCHDCNTVIWRQLPESTLVLCFSPANPPVHFFCVPYSQAHGGKYIWLGPVRHNVNWMYGEIELINPTKDELRSRPKRAWIDQIERIGHSWPKDWMLDVK